MQRVAVDVREYELVCSSVMPSLGIAYRSLPMELLDAFSHDPSAVTSGTRKRHGWRVVEDIHARVLRQREILASFLSGVKTGVDGVSIPENILDNPISALMEKLQALEREREPLQEQANEVSRMLMEIRAAHSTVKEEYNDALSYTSVVYSEVHLHLCSPSPRLPCECPAFAYRCIRRELQRSVSTCLGTWHGCFDCHPRYDRPILEKLRQNHRGRYAGFYNHSLVSK